MRRILVFTILIISQWSNQCLFGQEEIYRSMQQGFKHPPVKAQPNVYHWWLGGYVDTLRLKEEISAMKKAGIAGFTIFEIGSRDTLLVKSGPAFLSDKSLEAITVAVKEAVKLGMEVGLNTASSWNAGGNWLPPKHSAKSIYYSKKKIIGGENMGVKLPFPEIPQKDPWGKSRQIKFRENGKPVFYQEIAVLAIPSITADTRLDTSQIINITEYFDPQSEQLQWKAPPGKWNIFRYVCSNSGENLVLPSKHSAGSIVDHYDAEATEFHFMYIINRLQSVLGDLGNTALKSLYMASYEAKGFAWTTTLPDVFHEINGYKVTKFLPALFDENVFSPELTVHFKTDFQRTLSELMINNFYKKSKEVCNRYGLKNNSESGGPGLPLHNVPVEPIKALGAGLDIPRGEFWINHGRFNEEGIDILRVVKEVSSASHIYGRSIVEMEAFTTFQHWQEGPFEMKPAGDRSFCEGMNKVVVHGSTHNPDGTGLPGIVYHAGTHYNDKRVWWPKVKPFNDYLARVSYILQEADFQSDVLFYYGDTIPNYGGHKNSRFTAGPGYDYEIINTEILLNLSVKNKKLIIPGTGTEFSILSLTDEYAINPKVVVKLKELLDEGAIIIGEKPNKVVTRRMQQGVRDVNRLLHELWTTKNSETQNTTDKTIYFGMSPSRILSQIGVIQDVSYSDEDLYTLDYTHYSKDDLDFYFIRNTTDEWVSREIKFRQSNKEPELWDPGSGEIIPVPLFESFSDYTSFPLTLAPYESTFVVFREKNRMPYFEQLNYNKLVIEVANTWSNRLTGDAITGQSYTSTNIISTDVNNGYSIRSPWAEVPLIESGLFGPVTLTVINAVNTDN
jgi:hypothetical protein